MCDFIMPFGGFFRYTDVIRRYISSKTKRNVNWILTSSSKSFGGRESRLRYRFHIYVKLEGYNN